MEKLISCSKNSPCVPALCQECGSLIEDSLAVQVGERVLHSNCLRCCECCQHLGEKCFMRDDNVYCKEDFFRKFGTKCMVCQEGIPPSEIVRRVQDYVYHLDCFTCSECGRLLVTGDRFYMLDDGQLVCHEDQCKTSDLDKIDEDDSNSKRPRTTITPKQLDALKIAYSVSNKPSRHAREKLAKETNLDMRVVQVWFQNRRAKEKRMRRDFSRPNWEQYLKNHRYARAASWAFSTLLASQLRYNNQLVDKIYTNRSYTYNTVPAITSPFPDDNYYVINGSLPPDGYIADSPDSSASSLFTSATSQDNINIQGSNQGNDDVLKQDSDKLLSPMIYPSFLETLNANGQDASRINTISYLPWSGNAQYFSPSQNI